MINESETKAFLSCFPGSVIQYFTDNKNAAKESRIAKTSKEFILTEAEAMQKAGCGVYFTVNSFNDGIRQIKHLNAINGVFIDLDVAKEGEAPQDLINQLKAAELNRLQDSKLKPHFVVETKNGFDVIWLIDNCSKEQFDDIQARLVSFFHADPGSMDAAHVLRLPGALHLKNPAEPFLCQIVWDHRDLPKYAPQSFFDLLPPVTEKNKTDQDGNAATPKVPNNVNGGDSFQKAKNIDIAEVIKFSADKAGIKVEFKNNGDGSRQIIENGEITSGFISSRGEFVHSSSGKDREGNQITVAEYYLNEIGGNSYNRHDIAELLSNNLTNTSTDKEEKKTKMKTLRIISFKNLVARNLKKPEYLIENLIPEYGITEILGSPSSRKTWFALQCAISVATGKMFLDQFKTKKSNVLIINLDDHESLVVERLQCLNAPRDESIQLLDVEGMEEQEESEQYLITNKKDEIVETTIRTVKENKIGLIIFDTFRDVHNYDENKSEEIGKVLGAFKRIYKVAKCAIVIIHHNRKANDKIASNGMDSNRGSGSITGALTSMLQLTDEKSIKDGSKVTQLKNKLGRKIDPFCFQLLDCPGFDSTDYVKLVWAETKAKPDMFAARTAVIDYFLSNEKPGLPKNKVATDIVTRSGLPKNSVDKAIDEWENDKVLLADPDVKRCNGKYLILDRIEYERLKSDG